MEERKLNRINELAVNSDQKPIYDFTLFEFLILVSRVRVAQGAPFFI